MKMLPERMQKILSSTGLLFQYVMTSRYAQRQNAADISDFMFSNPQELPLEGFAEVLQKWAVPQNKDWFAHKRSEPESQALVAKSLQASHGVDFQPDDIVMTNGTFASIAVVLAAVTEPGDEVIYISPPWFCYESLILAQYAVPVSVPCDAKSYDLDLEAIRQAISPRTRAIIINSPNNPTGKIYPPETLKALAALLEEASAENKRQIYLLSDEAYSRILFDDNVFSSPAKYYPASFVLYTYSKVLLTPGQRIGYIAMPPAMPEREMLRSALFAAQLVTGFAFPNALLQHALPDLDALSVNLSQLQAKRDGMVSALSEMGYQLQIPQGSFYLLVQSPIEDDLAFVEWLAEQDVFCLPGSIYELPGSFRISLTATERMIERALPHFARVLELASKQKPDRKLSSSN